MRRESSQMTPTPCKHAPVEHSLFHIVTLQKNAPAIYVPAAII